MAKFKPIKQQRISAEVAEQLKQSFLNGHFKAGEKLPSEKDLADEFQVSRIAIREALRILENSGFVITRQGVNGGVFVKELTFDHITDAFLDLFLADKISIPELYHVRLLVEPEIARLAALNVTSEYGKRLKKAIENEELPTSSLQEDIEMKTAVHYILAEMCGNRFLEAILRSSMKLTHKIIEVVSPDPYKLHPPGMHNKVVDAVLARDPDEAYQQMRIHSIEFGEILIKMEKTYRERKISTLI
jgi:DNA-binding FadR family transcriptional regulator